MSDPTPETLEKVETRGVNALTRAGKRLFIPNGVTVRASTNNLLIVEDEEENTLAWLNAVDVTAIWREGVLTMKGGDEPVKFNPLVKVPTALARAREIFGDR